MKETHIVRKYYEAWSGKDLDRARSYLADDLDFQGPIDRFTSADEFLQALTGFTQMLTGADLLQEFYTDDEAALLYDCHTESPAGTIRTAEFFHLHDGKIARIRLVYDAENLHKMMEK